MSEAVVTAHAQKRTKERVGLPKRAVEKNAERALREGITHAETSGSLRRYMDSLFLTKRTANQLRIYCGNVYLFCNDVLITVVPLPQKYRATAEGIKKRRNRHE